MSDTSVWEKKTRRYVPGKSGRLVPVRKGATVVEQLKAYEEEAGKLALLLEMSTLLSSEKELDVLMTQIVDHATRMMRCERSSVLLRDKKSRELYALVAQGLDVKELRFSESKGIAGYCARTGEQLNIPDAYQDERFNQAVDKATGFRTKSILCMPLFDRQSRTLGVIQCLNKKDSKGVVTQFDETDEVFLSAVAAQAAILLENTSLYARMDELFAAFVNATSKSIDDRDPCTSGHSRRVTDYSLNLARAVHSCKEPPFDDPRFRYTRQRMRQLKYAALLHDAGKIGVRENVLCKSEKLPAGGMELIRYRFSAMREKSRADCLFKALSEHLDPAPLFKSTHDPLVTDMDNAVKVIDRSNLTGFLKDDDLAALNALHARGWITPTEHKCLSVRRGNLTEEEWDDMRSHVTKSFDMLKPIPWPEELKDLPEVAYVHHEKYDGTGYPRKLKQDEIHFDGHVMCVADIYDALTAADRPYKKAIPHERAMQILMEEEAAKGHIFPELVKLFFSAKCYVIDPSQRGSGLFGAVKGP